MSEIIDKKLQRAILTELRDNFGLCPASPYDLQCFEETAYWSDVAEYLHQHDLVKIFRLSELGRDFQRIHEITLTAKGLDYLTEDGGLTAELSRVYVVLDDHFISQLVEAVEQSELPPVQKSGLKKILASATKETGSEILRELARIGTRFLIEQPGLIGNILSRM